MVQESHAKALVSQPIRSRLYAAAPARLAKAPPPLPVDWALKAAEGGTLVSAAMVSHRHHIFSGPLWEVSTSAPAIYTRLMGFKKVRADKRQRRGRTYGHAEAPCNVAVAKALRLLRLWNLCECKELAEALGVGASTMANIEKPRSVVAMLWVVRYTEAFGVPEHAFWALVDALQEEEAKTVGTMHLMRRFVAACDSPPPPDHWEV